jgi:ribose 5-phosphate isomerase A
MADRERMKQLACQRAAQEVQDGMVLGLGTGSTVYYFLHELGRMVREGVRLTGVPTSVQTAQLATQLAIPLTTLDDQPHLDLAVDGADEVDGQLIWSRAGGALLREKSLQPVPHGSSSWSMTADSNPARAVRARWWCL